MKLQTIIRKFLVPTLLLVGLSLPVSAATLTFTYTGVGSGTLDGVPFSDKAFTIVGVGRNVDTSGAVPEVEHDSTEVTIADVGTYSFTTVLRTFRAGPPDTGSTGLSRAASEGGGDLYNSEQTPELANWYFDSSIGPITTNRFLLQWDLRPVLTSGGQLIFDNAGPITGTFQVTLTPDQATAIPVLPFWAFAFLAAGLLWLARRAMNHRPMA